MKTINYQFIIAELDATLFLNSSTRDLIELVELDASRIDVFDLREFIKLMTLARTSNTFNSQVNELNETLINQYKDFFDQSRLKVVDAEVSLFDDLNVKKIIELCSSLAIIDSSKILQ